MTPLRALIVDDERLARVALIGLLATISEIEVAGEAADVDSAAMKVKELNPDVIFLDIQMPGRSGFDLLERIDPRIRVVFVTAYDQFAVRAFEVNACDYLLKPINPDRLQHSIQRLLDIRSDPPAPVREFKHDDRLYLSFNDRRRFVTVASIVEVRAMGDYTQIVLADSSRGLVLRTMKEWEQSLPPRSFQRIHRSTIINLDHVEKITGHPGESQKLYLRGRPAPLKVSRRYARKLSEKFSI